MPTPRHQPTIQTRKIVESLAAHGNPHESICEMVSEMTGLSIKLSTLRKYYKTELKAVSRAHAKVRETLYKMATKGTASFQASTFFYCKTQMGMKETNVTELTGKNGKPITMPLLDVHFVDPDKPAS